MLNIYNNFFFYVVVILLTGYMKERQKMEDLDNNNPTRLASSGFCENKGLGGGCSVSRARKTWSREMLLKVMLHGSIRNDDFYRNTALQCWNNVVTIRNNVATMLQRCAALKIVVANRLL